ncbi:MAG: S-layer homology domain-containing protein, partial [Candidatus Absconditabacterales bacterium]
ELNDAYIFAYTIGITTQPTIQQADLADTLIRKHLAKMISNFAVKQLGQIPNTGLVCSFTDMDDESIEMKFYAKTACQLGLMGLDVNGVPISTFNPNGKVTRAQFGTVLSRALYGDLYNRGTPYYLNHLNALKINNIITNTDPSLQELRGYVMLMLMRAID